MQDKGRAPAGFLDDVLKQLPEPNPTLVAEPVTVSVVESARKISFADVPDLHDRLIGATALELGLPLLTADARLRGTSVRTVW